MPCDNRKMCTKENLYQTTSRSSLHSSVCQKAHSFSCFRGLIGLVIKLWCIAIRISDGGYKAGLAINIVGDRHEATVGQPDTVLSFNSTWIILWGSFVLSPIDPPVFLLQLGIVFTHAVCELVLLKEMLVTRYLKTSQQHTAYSIHICSFKIWEACTNICFFRILSVTYSPPVPTHPAQVQKSRIYQNENRLKSLATGIGGKSSS